MFRRLQTLFGKAGGRQVHDDLTPEQFQAIRDSPIENLSYFTEWGASAWERLIAELLFEDLGAEWFQGKRVLELGCRYGRMSTLFALLGAEVVGIDIFDCYVKVAEEKAEQFGVGHRADFATADLMEFCEGSAAGSFDLIFSKSVLVTLEDDELDQFLAATNRILSPGGALAAIENGTGNFALKSLRQLRKFLPGGWDHSSVRYFDSRRINTIRDAFATFSLRESSMPPVYAFAARTGEPKQDATRLRDKTHVEVAIDSYSQS